MGFIFLFLFLVYISLLFLFIWNGFLINFWGFEIFCFSSFFFLFFQFLVFLLFFILFIFLFLVYFCNFFNLYLSLIFSCWFSFFPSFGFLNTIFAVLNFNCSFLFFFVWVWEKVHPSFVCWAIVWTKTHATCESDHLWNDGLWIKQTLMPILVRVTSFKLLILSGIPTWGVGYRPHVMTKLKRDENLANLI